MQALLREIAAVPGAEIFGRVRSIKGLLVEIAGPVGAMSVGSRVRIAGGLRGGVTCEVVGFRNDRALALPFGPLEGVRMGAKAILEPAAPVIAPSNAWLGRVVNALGEPIDGKGPLTPGPDSYPLRASPPPAHRRARVGAPAARASAWASFQALAWVNRSSSPCSRAIHAATYRLLA